MNGGKGIITCSVCQQLVDELVAGFAIDASDEDIANRLAEICVTVGIYNYKVCYGASYLAMV